MSHCEKGDKKKKKAKIKATKSGNSRDRYILYYIIIYIYGPKHIKSQEETLQPM